MQKLYCLRAVVLLLLIIMLSSCGPIIKLIYGVKNPKKIIPQRKVLGYANDNALDTNLIAYPTGYDAFAKVVNLFHGVPDVLVFNKDGKFVPYKAEGVSCNAPVDTFLASLNSEVNYSSTDSITADMLYDNLILSGYARRNDLRQVPDFTVFMSWTRWMGNRLYREHNKLWLEAINNNTMAKFNVVCVNLDFIKERIPEERK